MSRTEDRLRDAFAAAAQTVEPDSLHPLAAPAPRRRRPKWAAPLAVAAAVTLIAVAGTTLGLSGDRDGQDGATGELKAGAPPYIVAVRRDIAGVLDARTGRMVHRLPQVAGKYRAVAAAGDARTFFLAAQEAQEGFSFVQVDVGPDGEAGRPQRIPGPPLQVEMMGQASFAANRDGSKLALAGTAKGQDAVAVVDTASGRQRTWTAPGKQFINSVTWSPDNRTVGFIWLSGPTELTDQAQLRLLDTERTPVFDLRRSWPIRGVTLGTELINVFIFNPDGRTLTAQTQGDKSGPDDHADYRLIELSAADAEPTGRKVRLPSDSFFAKVDASGQHFLQIIDGRVGRVDGDRFAWVTSKHGDYEDAAW